MKPVQKVLSSIALASFTMAQPLAAQAAAPARASAPVAQSEELFGGSVFAILGVFVALLLIGEVTGAINVFGDDSPKSP